MSNEASHPAKPLRGHDGFGISLLMAARDLKERARRLRMLSCDVDGVLTDGTIIMDEKGHELRAYSSLDGFGMKMLERSGILTAWITGSDSPSVAKRASKLGIKHVIQGREDKLPAWQELLASLSLSAEQCAYIGDDLADLPVIVRCGLGVTVPNAPTAVRRRAHYVTRASGGRGAVREVVELILSARGELDAILRKHGAGKRS